MTGNEHEDRRIEIEAFGPGPETVEAVSQAALSHPSVREELGEGRHRLLSVRLLPSASRGKPGEPLPPDRYRATIYDYTDNRVLLVTGSLEDIQGSMEVSEAGHQPLPTRDEFDEAVEVLLEDEELGPAIREERLVPYRPMPPLVETKLPDGRAERTLAVGLLPQANGVHHEIVGANMVHRTAARFPEGAPALALARGPRPAACRTPTSRPPRGASPASSRSPSRMTTGARSGVFS